ncbi:hypothetical protein A2V94_07120 [Candidatus Atribacteria bacterium RBG_16_35_8]|nr:MAG: hypothetical protein A2V94_07120 [Candidatus Atribacteria bacterium RBG_16_35_8]
MMNFLEALPPGLWSSIWYVIIATIVFVIYFLPTWIAIGKNNSVLIFFLNLFLGVTGIVWLILFIWACASSKRG